MKILDINPKDIIFALDIGTRSIIGNIGIVKDRKFHTLCEKYMEHEERAMIDGQIHDINLVASTVNSIKKFIEEELEIEIKRSEEHTSELQSRQYLVCRLLLEKK